MGLLFILALQFNSTTFFPTAPPDTRLPEVCTVAGLKLPTSAIDEVALRKLATAKWGVNAFTRQIKMNDARYSVVEVGFKTLLSSGDPGTCPSSTCFQNRVGSWRKLWNSILIGECIRRQAK